MTITITQMDVDNICNQLPGKVGYTVDRIRYKKLMRMLGFVLHTAERVTPNPEDIVDFE